MIFPVGAIISTINTRNTISRHYSEEEKKRKKQKEKEQKSK